MAKTLISRCLCVSVCVEQNMYYTIPSGFGIPIDKCKRKSQLPPKMP